MREAWKNAAASWFRSTLLLGVAIGSSFWITATDVTQISELIQFRRAVEAAGGSVVVAQSDEGISAAECDRLNSAEFVIAAGGYSRGETSYLESRPGNAVRVGYVTSRVLSVMDPESNSLEFSRSGLALSASFAQRRAVGEGDFVSISGVPVRRVGTVLDSRDRMQSVEASVFLSSPPLGKVSQCWVEVKPGFEPWAAATVGYELADAETSISVYPLLRTGPFDRDVVAEYENRIGSHAWIGVGIGLGLMGLLIQWSRRSEIALLRAMGGRRILVAALIFLETGSILAFGTTLGTITALLLNASQLSACSWEPISIALRTGLSGGLLGWALLGPISVMFGSESTLLAHLKERD
jgi:hypothetical protein